MAGILRRPLLPVIALHALPGVEKSSCYAVLCLLPKRNSFAICGDMGGAIHIHTQRANHHRPALHSMDGWTDGVAQFYYYSVNGISTSCAVRNIYL